MTDVMNNITLHEAVMMMVLFLCGWLYCLKKKRQRSVFLFWFSIGIILHTTLLRRIPGAWEQAVNLTSTTGAAKLEFVGFNLSGFLLNVLLYVPLGISLKRRRWAFPFLLCVLIELAQQLTHLGMFDVWDILANTVGGVLGVVTRYIIGFRKRRSIQAQN